MKNRELNARPIKKVAEAKARKKMKAMKKFEKLKQTAQSIADASDMTPGFQLFLSSYQTGEKTRQIEKLYKKQAKLGKFNSNAKTYVVSKKGGSAKRVEGGKPGRTKRVDPLVIILVL
jgi:AdoMet-dependent rRNA methyltransferase SPB1